MAFNVYVRHSPSLERGKNCIFTALDTLVQDMKLEIELKFKHCHCKGSGKNDVDFNELGIKIFERKIPKMI